MIRLPAGTLPVNVTCLTSWSWIITGPISASRQLMTFRTPGGSAPAIRSKVLMKASGVVGGVLITAVLPASRA